MGMINTKINGKYELLLPQHRADREQWDLANGGWEVKRTDLMIETIKDTDIVFDIGVEEGDITGLLSKYTGCDLVMFEPNDRVWPCIKAIWDANNLKQPLDFFRGFVSNKTTVDNYQIDNSIECESDLVKDHGFKQLYENYPHVPQIKLDDYCRATGIYPNVITMDVEGSEFEVIKGAKNVLMQSKPIIFMSVHPEFMFESYKQWVVHMLRFIDECGYTHDCIEYDYHELHMRFDPK